MAKKGLMDIPFVMIFALVLGSMILVWGIAQVGKLISFGSEVQMLDVISSIRGDIESYYYLDEGSSKLVKFRFPKKITYICFYDPTAKWKPSPNAPKLNRALIQAINRSVFVLPLKAYETTAFNIENLRPIAFNPFCVKNGLDGGKFKITTTRARFVEVS